MADDHAKVQRQMNNALDGDLSEQEIEALSSQFEASPQAVEDWNRLEQTDHLLRTTPLEAPSPGFTDRVMAAIASMHLRDFASRRYGLSLAVGLIVVALLTVPLLSAALILLLTTIANPSTFHVLFQLGTDGARTVLGLAADLEDGLETVAGKTVVVPALLTTVIPMSLLWVWLVWYLSGRKLRPGSESA